jgi:chaperonin GroES
MNPTITYNTPQGQAAMPKLATKTLIESPNIAELIDRATLDQIGKEAVEGYAIDLGTRSQWAEQNAKAIKLALQVVEFKNFPWENCSNVKFPLLTIAALQFLARVSILTKGRHLAKVDVIGSDPEGKKSAQARRLSRHLSLQLTDYDVNWIDSDEEAKLAASILGSAFKKTYYDAVSGITHSEHVPAMNFVVDYYCKDIDKARRITHLLHLDDNAVQERVRRGLFLKPDAGAPPSPQPTDTNVLKQAADEAEGVKRPVDTMHTPDDILEQHTWLDLDGDDYREPYILFVRRETGQVLRIVARYFDEGDVHRVNDGAIRMLEAQLDNLRYGEDSDKTNTLPEQSALEKRIDALEKASNNHIVRIDPTLNFTRYLFIPSPDGGVYGLGMGSLLGPMNESVNTLVNQIIDGGTMSNTAGGFLGRGVKIKGGKMSFDPFEWKPVDSSGDDLRKNIFPLPVREPSAVLFQLLGMLVTYSEKISGSTDIMTGVSPGQNTPAETSRNTVEQGMMLFSGIYARMYRSFKRELEKFHDFNRLYLPTSPLLADLTQGPNAILASDDYIANAFRILPAASPEAVSTTQRREKAKMLHALALSQPGFNTYKVTRDLLEAWDFDDIEDYYPDPAGPKALPAPKNPKMEIEMAKLQQKDKEHQGEMQLAMAELQADMVLNEAKIGELQAKAALHIAEARGVDTGHQIAMFDAQIGAARAKQEGLMKALELVQKQAALHHTPAQPKPQGSQQKPQGTSNEGKT